VNPRKRRGTILLVLAGLLSVVMFVLLSSYVASINRQVGGYVKVLELRADVAAYTPVTEAAVEQRDVPARWAPSNALHDTGALAGTVAAVDLRRGSYIQTDMVINKPLLEPNQRETAILIDAETGVAGKVIRGSRVDIIATYPGTQTAPPRSEIIVPHARVVDVGKLEDLAGTDDKGGVTSGKVVPVTFALTVREALVLTYAESFATKVRLALVAPGDSDIVPGDQTSFTLPPPAVRKP
jgi:pilus assembly protein CpaB